MTIDTQNFAVKLDGEGYLVNPEEWTPELAKQLAEREGIRLEEDHWHVLDFMRHY